MGRGKGPTSPRDGNPSHRHLCVLNVWPSPHKVAMSLPSLALRYPWSSMARGGGDGGVRRRTEPRLRVLNAQKPSSWLLGLSTVHEQQLSSAHLLPRGAPAA